MTNHLKKSASPKTWLARKGLGRFVVRPNPGAHSFSKGVPLGSVLRDYLEIASTMGEIKKILNNNDILVDGKRRKDHEFVVGLFDVIQLPLTKKSYRMILDQKGRLTPISIDQKEIDFKPGKITGKKVLPKGKIQFNLHDGKSLIGDFNAKIGDSLIISLPDLKVKEVLPLKEGVSIYLLEGKHAGDLGHFKKLVGAGAVYLKDGNEIETAKEYLFVVGKDKPVVALGQEHPGQSHKKAETKVTKKHKEE